MFQIHSKSNETYSKLGWILVYCMDMEKMFITNASCKIQGNAKWPSKKVYACTQNNNHALNDCLLGVKNDQYNINSKCMASSKLRSFMHTTMGRQKGFKRVGSSVTTHVLPFVRKWSSIQLYLNLVWTNIGSLFSCPLW
jgi:hypothetical protein